MKRTPPEMAREIMQSLRGTIGDDDTAALILISACPCPSCTLTKQGIRVADRSVNVG